MVKHASMSASMALLASVLVAVTAVPANAATVTYSASQTIPVPPASSYAGSGGGDGWGLAFTATQVFNVFHHSGQLTVACHLQSDASACWSPVTVSDPSSQFATPGHAGLWMDSATSRLYVYATRSSDLTAGVVCIDTPAIGTGTDPYCGFTALSAVGDAPEGAGFSELSDPVRIGTRWYAYNHNAADPNRPAVLCFDTVAKAACLAQPYSAPFSSTLDQSNLYPPPASAAVGTKLFIELGGNLGPEITCFDSTTNARCAGTWPAASSGTGYGAPYPLLDASGSAIGVCLPDGAADCYGLDGTAIAAPPGLAAAMGSTSGWNGGAVVLGARVYIPDGSSGAVRCYDFNAAASCTNFPRYLANASLVYTVNADPARPTCLWTNADTGSAQIQNFDAYSGGACGDGPVRVLASQFIVPTSVCQPTTYSSLQIVSPAPGTYSSGSVAFEDGNANPIAGVPDVALDGTGSASLSGLNLNTATGLPQFLITLNNAGAPGAVSVKLTWTGTDDPTCVNPGTTVSGGGGGVPCPDVLVVAAMGSGQKYVSDTDLSVSPQLTKLYNGIVATKGTKTVALHVLNYPADGVEVIYSGISSIRGSNKLDTYNKMLAKLGSNIGTYLAGKDQGVAAMHGVLTAVEFGCIGKPTKLMLIGYSQGAMVIHEFLADLRGSSLSSYVVGVGLLADPERVKNSAVVDFGTAIGGSYGICDVISTVIKCDPINKLADIPSTFLSRTISVCQQLDPVCATSDVVPRLVSSSSDGRKALLKLVGTIHSQYSILPATTRAGNRLGQMIARS